jgi:hypothetical protein
LIDVPRVSRGLDHTHRKRECVRAGTEVLELGEALDLSLAAGLAASVGHEGQECNVGRAEVVDLEPRISMRHQGAGRHFIEGRFMRYCWWSSVLIDRRTRTAPRYVAYRVDAWGNESGSRRGLVWSVWRHEHVVRRPRLLDETPKGMKLVRPTSSSN